MLWGLIVLLLTCIALVLGIFLLFLEDLRLVFTVPVYQLTMLISFLSIILSFLVMHLLLLDKKQKVEIENCKKHTVRDFYLYHDLMDPPEMNT